MRFINQGNRNYAGRYKPDREWNKKSQPEYGEKTCTGIRDAIKAGICSDANKKLNVKSMRIISAEISIFNQNLYFQNPDYLEGSYREEKLLD